MSFKRHTVQVILSAIIFTSFAHAADKGSATRNSFSRALRTILDSINAQMASTVLEQVSDIPTKVACMSYSNFNSSKALGDQMIELRKEGVIDLNIYKKYYEMMLQRIVAQVSVSAGQSINSESQLVKLELEGSELTVIAFNKLIIKFDATADNYNNSASMLKGVGSISSEPSHGELLTAINEAISILRELKVPTAGSGILAVLITELDALKKRVERKKEMNKWERKDIAKIFPTIFDFSAQKLIEIGAIYRDTSKALKGLIKEINKGKTPDEIQTGLNYIIAELDARAAAGSAQSGSGAGSISEIDAHLVELDVIIKRVDKFRELEDMVIDIQAPICDEIKTYNDLKDPKSLFIKIGQDFSSFAAESTPFKKEFAENSSKISQQILASSKQSAKNYGKVKVPPVEPDDCGNMYVEPLEAPATAELTSSEFSSYRSAIKFPSIKPPLGSCKGSECIKKSPSSPKKNGRYTKSLERQAKKFIKNKQFVIQSAFAEVYGRNMNFSEKKSGKTKKPSLYPCE